MAQDNKFRDELLARLSLADVIGKRVKLKKSGRGFTGLCPFHSEKTASFSVVEDKGFYHCFGCGASGNAITFVMETDGLNYREAINELAKTIGLKVPEYKPINPETKKHNETKYDVLQKTANYFHKQLFTDEGKEAYEFLLRRGLDDNDIQKFSLGYAPKNSTALLDDAFKNADATTVQMLEDVSLIRKSDRDNSYYAFFRDRIMFPIHDRKGQVIAFGGRYLKNKKDVGKYINSADHELFHKGENLYNYHQTLSSIKENKNLIIAEGYMDVIALSKHGFSAVAPLGTAMTESQMRQAWRLDKSPIMAFDGDNAGKQAAHRTMVRSLPLLTPVNSFRFIFLPDGEDPDSYLQAYGSRAFNKYLQQAQNSEDFLWNAELEKSPQNNNSSNVDKANFSQNLMDLCDQITNHELKRIYKNGFKEKLFQLFKIIFKKQAISQKFSDSNIEETTQIAGAGLTFLLIRFPTLMDRFSEELNLHLYQKDETLDKFMQNLYAYSLSQDNDWDKLSQHMQNSESAQLWNKMIEKIIKSDIPQKAKKLYTANDVSSEEEKIASIMQNHIEEFRLFYQQKILTSQVKQSIQGKDDSLIDARVQALGALNEEINLNE